MQEHDLIEHTLFVIFSSSKKQALEYFDSKSYAAIKAPALFRAQ
jgi:hypothetical protein